MFNTFKRLLNQVEVTDLGHSIVVSGVDAPKLAASIQKHWKSSRIDAHLFTHVDRSSFSFQRFFAPDVLFTLDQLVGSRSLRIPSKTLDKIRLQLLQNTWLSKTREPQPSKLNFRQLDKFVMKPLDFQQDFLEQYSQLTQAYDLSGFLLAGTAGSGKTLSSLFLMECLGKERVIIVCPKNALDEVWLDTLGNPQKVKSPFEVYDIRSSKPYAGEKYILTHYEGMPKLQAFIAALKGMNVGVVLDESHNLNEITTARPLLFLDICQKVNSKDTLWLSGTPFKAVTREAIPLFRCIDGSFTEDVEMRFRKIYKDSNDRGVEIIRHRMGMVSFKVEKKQLDLGKPEMPSLKIQLPDGKRFTMPEVKKKMVAYTEERFKYYKTREREDAELFNWGLTYYEATLQSAAEREAYRRYRNSLRIILETKANDCADEMKAANAFELRTIFPTLPKPKAYEWRDNRSNYKYLHLKIQGEVLGRIVGGMRVECHVAMVPFIPFVAVCESTLKKTVVFTSYTAVLEKIAEHLQPTNLNPVLVYGKTNHELAKIVGQFGSDERINPLAATYKSLSTAVPLIMADTMIIIDHPYRDYTLQQAISRIHRLGQDSQVVVYRCELDTGDTVNLSSRNLDILAWSQKQIKEIFGVESPFQIQPDADGSTIGMAVENLSMEANIDMSPRPDLDQAMNHLSLCLEGFDEGYEKENLRTPVSMTSDW